MDSFLLASDSSDKSNSSKNSDDCSGATPAWKFPLSKSYSTSLTNSGGGKEDSNRLFSHKKECDSGGSKHEDEEETQVIQILLPCIICNRTFSPEALERHAKVCTQVHVESKTKQSRGKFNSAEQRIKDTPVADFIPPPIYDPPDPSILVYSAFARGSRNRSSLRGTSCTSGSNRLKNATVNNSVIHPPWRRERSQSQIPTTRSPIKGAELSGDASESEESQTTNSINGGDNNGALPSYARALSPSAECPYCRRFFGKKAFDRHLSFCKELFVRKQYDIQPAPKEKEEAMERQEIRTKYRPMKGSSSCSSLRSISPPKDFTSMALKLFGMRRSSNKTDGSNNLYNKQNNLQNNFKKSNESLVSSCYGDFNRPSRRSSPSPVRNPNNTSTTNKINNLISKSYLYNNKDVSKGSLLPMRINTSSNIPKKIKSTESLPATTNPYEHVRGSGYGPQDTMGRNAANNLSRGSKSRSSLHKNFFRTKRVEPEGTENTSTPTTPNALIITPMNFFSKTKMSQNQNHHLHRENSMTMEQPRPKDIQILSASDPDYDPYEKAAKQLEELLKTQPASNYNNNKRTQRKVGLDRAFQSVTAPTLGLNFDSGSTTDGSSTSTDGPRKNSYDSIALNTTDPFSFDLSTLDDSYWDQILQKSSRSHSNPSHQLKSQGADITPGDNNKSRAVSNISSADSAFSRSDGTDLEFEALETLMNLGGVPSTKAQLPSATTPPRTHTSLARILSPTRELSPQSQKHSISSASENEPDTPMRISPSPSNQSAMSSSLSQKSSHHSSSVVKFCYECGTPYPTTMAKFCSECGQKRVLHV